MIGPSSSHTAGAARIGLVSKIIYAKPIRHVRFYLHGSFATTYSGHGSDKALVAGIIGFLPDDDRIRDAFQIAQSNHIHYEFIPEDLGYYHPNTVKVVFVNEKEEEEFFVIASSIGGGNIEVKNINGMPVNFTGEYPTIIAEYVDRNGMIADISIILTNSQINIASLHVTRKNGIAAMIMELDEEFNDQIIDQIKGIPEILYTLGIHSS